jgi:CHAT domain-containing protein/Tfp pilus assembly protein PilF
MRQGANMDQIDDPTLLRRYLLGTLDEAGRVWIEERLIVDDEYAVRINAAEDELIEQFLDGDMTEEDSELFNRFFLAPPERRRQLRLIRGLRLAASERTNEQYNNFPHRKRSLTEIRGWLRFAFVAAVLLVAAFAVWRVALVRSDAEKGTEQLQAAFRDQRPIESRITELTAYAPFSETRGNGQSATDPAALDRANHYLMEAAADPNNAAAHRGLAMYYLATHDIDRAIREINTALKASPDDAHVQSDAGAVFYEASKDALGRADAAKQMTLLDESLKHLDRAIELNAKSPEPRFDRALCIEALMNIEQAKAAWHEYLEIDLNSRWAEEAKRHLQKLEENTPTDRSADELESDFLAAFRSVNRTDAERLAGESRELIREKYLPQRLAISYTMAEPERRDELLQALEYSGDIESKLTGDGYANDIARFYSTNGAEKLETLRAAQDAIRQGYANCRANEYQLCLASFQSAQEQFQKAGDEPEARLAEYLAGYAQYNVEDHQTALATFNSVVQFAQSRRYIWLEMTATHWMGTALEALKKNTNALSAYERALSLARQTRDGYATDRNLIAMAELESYSRQDAKALELASQALTLSSAPAVSLRQRYRDLAAVLPVLSHAGLYHAARFTALESVAVADLQKEPTWIAQSRGYAGVAFEESGDPVTAKRLLDESRSAAESITNLETRQKVSAFALLRSGDVEYASGNFQAAAENYSAAANLYDGVIEIPLNREQAHIGLLQADLALGKKDAVAAEIPINIRLTEERRYGILDESQRTGFFDSRINVYDIASEFELSRQNAEAAYDYAEASSSRSLLDHMFSGLDKVDSAESEQALLHGNAAPLRLDEIRAAVPADSQIVQYSVFADKLVIWLVSRDDFSYVVEPISAKDLSEKIGTYAALVSRPNGDAKLEQDAALELYDVLIAPIHDRLAADHKLCIVPNRVLFEVPFAALLDADGKRLIQNYSLVYSPSANVFISATSLAAQKTLNQTDESILVVGDPAFDSSRHRDLPKLSDASAEARTISLTYGSKSRSLIGESATKLAFLDALQEADVVHFAGHYVAQRASPMSSYLLFASRGNETGELTDLDLARMSLKRTRLVVLAACDSAGETWYEGEGIIGGARSLLAAGVPLVVASQWAIDSAATSELMTRFHQFRRGRHQPTASALREAQMAMIDDQTVGYESPYYWAGFGVFGGAAKF